MTHLTFLLSSVPWL